MKYFLEDNTMYSHDPVDAHVCLGDEVSIGDIIQLRLKAPQEIVHSTSLQCANPNGQ